MANLITLDQLHGALNNFNTQTAKYNATHVNLPTIKDVPTLNNALRTGQINKGQWAQQFKTIQATAKGFSQPQNVGVGAGPTKFGLSAIKAYTPTVLNQQIVQPIKHDLGAAVTQAKNQVKYLSGPTSTQQQRTSIVQNQKSAVNNSN